MSQPEGLGKNVHSKLAQLNERFSGFERQIEQETRRRRDDEEGRLGAIKDNLHTLEKTLNSEIKRRVEANKALQQMFEQQIGTVQEKLEQVFVDRLDQLQSSVDSINERMTLVERDFCLEREKYVRDIEDKNALVAKDVGALQNAFENERQQRTDKEAAILKRLGDIEYRTEGRLEHERSGRDNRLASLKEQLEEALRQREKGDEKFQTFILEEVAAVKNGLVMESQAREQSDDDIVAALNHYTKALQDALRIVNAS